ncbi:hypothetical protein JCM11957_15980 [Caminibacter profundus]
MKRLMLASLMISSLIASSYKYTPTLPKKYTPNNSRVLAATTCFQCHGSFGVSKTRWDSIIGEDAEDFYENRHPIMKAQRAGFAKQEVRGMFNYLHSLKYSKYEYKSKKYYYNDYYNEHYKNKEYEHDEDDD